MERIRAWTVVMVLCSLVSANEGATGNIHPDPGFESSGQEGEAHEGSRAGVLTVGAGREHWRTLGGDLPVEPFATYRATAWIKGGTESGTLYGIYSYGWNSFGWAFDRSAPFADQAEWRKVNTTFVVPANRVTFHPLAALDARNVRAFVDDVSVVRIKSAAETIAQLLRKDVLGPEERQLLARYHLSRGERAAVAALRAGARQVTKADISCLLAQTASSPAERRKYTAEMIGYECMRWPDGKKRVRELTADLSPMERWAVALRALRLSKGSAAVVKALDLVLGTGEAVSEGPVGDADAALSELEDALKDMAPEDRENQALRKGLNRMREHVSAMRRTLEERKAALGTCRLIIGGTPVTAETHRIIVPDDPTPQERHAARELRAHLERLTGLDLPVVPETEAGKWIPLFVGACDALADWGMAIDFDSLGTEGIHLMTRGPALALAGNQRGVLYAVYTFLEDYCGCRWFTADCTVVPRNGTFRVRRLDRRYLPPLEYRATDYPNSRPPEFAVRNKLNGNQVRSSEKWGGSVKYRGFVHTFNALVPPETYFAAHPEYYSEVKGVRLGPDRTQLCLTNPDVLRIATATVRRWIAQSPEASIISVSQNDWHNYCECARCSALAEKEESQAGPLLYFVNAIADAVGDEHPEIIIDTLAYQYTRKPPKYLKPRPNVAIRLCSIECCFVHPLAKCPYNASFVADIRAWSRICKRLHIWDYVINYAHCIQPFPNLNVLKPNIRFFIDNGVTGIYEEANYFSKGGELAELRTYIMAKTLWDPSYDTKTAVEEFLAAYYGGAAAPIAKYLKLVHRTVSRDRKRHVRIYTPPRQYLNDPDMLSKAEGCFDRAEEAVKDDPVRLHRVRVARLPIIYTRLALGQTGFRLEGDAFVSRGAGNRDLLARFETIARAEGVTHVREGRGGGLETWLERMKSAHRPVQLVRLRSPHLEATVIPGLGGRVWSLRHLGKGLELLKVFRGEDESYQIDRGGYEEYSGADYRAPGWNEIYRVAEKTGTSVVLEGKLANGYVMRRRIELLPDRPVMKVTSTLVRTSGGQESCLRVHPAFAVADTAEATAWLRNPDGSWRKHSLRNPADPKAEKELWLRGAAAPAGAWAIRDDRRGVAVLNRFDPGEVEFCYLNWNGAQGRVNLEQWSRRRDLKAGEALTVTNSYEILTDRVPWEAE